MKSVRRLLVGALTLTLWGCGGGGGGPQAGGNTSPLDTGRANLNRLAGGQQPANAQTLQSVFDLFNQALQTTPGSAEAHFGAAVCLAGMVGQQADSPGVELPPPPPTSGGSGSSGGAAGTVNVWERPPAPPGYTQTPAPILPHQELGLVWNLDRGLSNPLTLLGMLAPITDLRFGLLAYYGYQGDDPASRQKMLASLDSVSQHLDQVETDPNFTYTLTLPQVMPPGIPVPANGTGKVASRAAQTVTIGLPEVYLFHAYVHSMRAEIALSLAYVRETGDWHSFLPSAGAGSAGSSGGTATSSTVALTAATPKTLDKNQDGKLTPDEYLPPSPFLTLRDAAYLHKAQAAMQAVADKAARGIEGVLARPADNASFLAANKTDVRTNLTNLRDNVLPLIRQAAIGPVTFTVPHYEAIPLTASSSNGKSAAMRPRSRVFAIYPYPGDMPPVQTTETVTVNIAAWFAHPPADLKTLAPTLPLDSAGYPNLDAAIYPDPTFAGLFPNGLPKNLLF